MAKKRGLSLRAKTIVLALISFYTQPAFGLTGNDWNKIPSVAQDAYIMAVVDTWRNAAYLCRETSYTDKDNPVSKTFNCEFFSRMNRPLEWCFEESPYNQLVAIVKKYMNENPQYWNSPMAFISYRALNDACKQLKP